MQRKLARLFPGSDMTNEVDTLTLTAEIVSAYVGNASRLNAADLPEIIRSVRRALDESAETSTRPRLAQRQTCRRRLRCASRSRPIT